MSITTLGSAAGGFLGGFASDYVGRRMTILASDVIFILGAVLLGTASTSVQLIVGRTVIGFAIGVASIVVPVYIAEVSPKSIRAMLVVLFSLQIGVGLCLAFIGGFALSASSSAAAWRIILALPAIAAVLQLAAMAFLPESPRWLAHSGRIAEAEAVMRTLTAAPGASSALGGTPTVSAADAAAEEEITMELREVYREGKFLRTPDGQTEAWNLRPRPVATQLALGVGLSCLHSLAGARTIDAAIGGLGGCPFAPGASGNVATEDVVYMLERAGIRTGIDLGALVQANQWLGAVMDRTLPGMVARAPAFPKVS